MESRHNKYSPVKTNNNKIVEETLKRKTKTEEKIRKIKWYTNEIFI